MSFEFEYSAVINPDTLENPVSVEQTVVENRSLRIGLIQKLAVQPDFKSHDKSSYADIYHLNALNGLYNPQLPII